MPLKKLERQWYTILCGNTKAVWVATLKPNPPLHVRPVWCPSYQVCNTLIDVVVSLWNVTTIPVFSMPVRERFSRELQGRPRPRGRATPAPHGSRARCYRRKNGPPNAKHGEREASKGALPGTACSVLGKRADPLEGRVSNIFTGGWC